MSLRTFVSAALLTANVIACRSLRADEQVDYLSKIKPILAARCYSCHGILKQEAGLRLDTAVLAIKGGDSGPAIKPGDAASSLLIQRVTAKDESERMPGEGEPLKPEQIEALRTWINQKATAPASEQPERDPRVHWAFRPIVRPAVPDVANSSWVRNPIDAFIAANHQRQGLTPQIEATRSELVRRLYLDLIGLPPTPKQIQEANSDAKEGWYERLTDRLLNSPQHGERWARHWMDIWRYSDWWGFGTEMRNSQPHIWHWRDWIVESLNANLPYSEMVRLMLAADELYPNDLDKLRATGFLARNYVVYDRNLWLEDTIEHVSKGFLGLTMNCAKCHDHKFDPIKQTDFYRMRAFFEPCFVRLDVVPKEPDLKRDGIPRVFDARLDQPTYLYIRGQETNPDKAHPLAPGVPEIFAFKELAIKPIQLPRESCEPERRPWVLETYLAAASENLAAAEKSVAKLGTKREAATKKMDEITKSSAPNSPPDEKSRKAAETAVADATAELHVATVAVEQARFAMVSVKKRAAAMRVRWVKADRESDNTKLAEAESSLAAEALEAERRAEVMKGLSAVTEVELRLQKADPGAKPAVEAELKTARDALAKAEQAAAAPLTKDARFTPLVGAKPAPTRFINNEVDDEPLKFADRSTGRRTALADWVTDRKNPLTARVAANHIWNRHFGTPLAPNTFDLGRNSPPPTNPELLNWLAAELMDSGWDMKHLHRLIVNSATYRLSSKAMGRETDVAKDPDNVFWWRRNPIRVESEVIRDSILSLAGTLDLTRGGPSVPPEKEADSLRRSLYFFHSNNERNLFLTTFDLAMVTECYRREQSIVPQQALALTNGRLTLDSAKPISAKIAASLRSHSADVDDAAFISSAFLELLGAAPDAAELRASEQVLADWLKLPKTTTEDARSYFVWSLLNDNDFVTLR
jgi:uncharacterized protein DUF1553/uncharacterized protein DUF1549/cytochrome c